MIDTIPEDDPRPPEFQHLPLSRQERKRQAKAAGKPFVPLAPPPVDVPQLSEMDKMEEALLDMIDSLNALTPDGKPAWFLLGPYAFHVGGEIYLHNSTGKMETWTVLDEEKAELARGYLRDRMKLQAKGTE